MRVLETLPTTPFDAPCALTIGTFDGVHRGHAALVARLRKEAASRGLPTAVLTFQDMPYCYFKPNECSRLLTLPHEKIAAFAPLQIDTLLIVPFNAQIAEQSAADFVLRVLVEILQVKLLVVGPDFALGKGRSGDVAALRALGEMHGFETIVLSEKIEDEGPISSTRIRECVEDGHMKTATRLLGRRFEIGGNVVGGQQIGRTIGVPTINLQVHARKVLPSNGVYACFAQLENAQLENAQSDNSNTSAPKSSTQNADSLANLTANREISNARNIRSATLNFQASNAESPNAESPNAETSNAETSSAEMTSEQMSNFEVVDFDKIAALNIGNRPTVGGQNVSVEFHVIGENIESAPPEARLQIVERLRDERKFSGLPALVEQMKLDIARAAQILRAGK